MKNSTENFDLLMAFPKYRRLKNRLKVVNRDNKNLRKSWETQIRKNEVQDVKLKKYREMIKKLKKEIKELKKDAVKC